MSTKPLRGARRRTPGLQSGVGRPETSDVVLEGSPGSSRTPVAKRAPDCGLQPPGLLVRCGRQQVLTPAPGSWLQNPGRPAAMKGGRSPQEALCPDSGGLSPGPPAREAAGRVPWAPTHCGAKAGPVEAAGSAFGHECQDTRLQRRKQRVKS